MEQFEEVKIGGGNTFLSHVFSSTEEGKAEILNIIQYSTMGVVPIVILNKLIQRFIPEADPEKSTLELLVEIFIQLIVMFCGIIIIHRAIIYAPTYSGFKYESLTLTNVILAFLIIVLSIQTKLGMKVNILVDRALELWNGPSSDDGAPRKRNVRTSSPVSQHSHSQADYLDNSQVQNGTFPPAPVATTRQNSVMETYDNMLGGSRQPDYGVMMGPMAANSVLGSSFGASF
jgi:hypothetical protein|uniref:Uncharacterized protein n=1 Tax=viral metagenome TaxID=1070528 RepID=A0A6C0HCE6_9ZZZZ